MKYKIEVLVMGEVARTAETDCPKEAKRIYWQTADSYEFYTQLYINGQKITMAAANKLFPLSPRQAGNMNADMYSHFQEERRLKGAEPLNNNRRIIK